MADKRGISGRNLARLDNTLGVPTFVLNKDVSGAGTTSVVADAPFEFRVIDAWSIGTNASAGSWRVENSTYDITGDVDKLASDYDVDRAININDAYYTISKGGDLNIVTIGSMACTVYVLCARV